MSRRKPKETPVDTFELNTFPVDVIVSTTQLPGLVNYSYVQNGVSFDGEIEFRHLTVTGPVATDEEPNNGEEQN
jgi:hypothetical protein